MLNKTKIRILQNLIFSINQTTNLHEVPSCRWIICWHPEHRGRNVVSWASGLMTLGEAQSFVKMLGRNQEGMQQARHVTAYEDSVVVAVDFI